jgi:putative peptidoglycan lipid II flippase
MSLKGARAITRDSAVPEIKTTSAVATVDTSTPSTIRTTAERGPSGRRRHWGGRTFRFSPSSFHLGSNFSLRRFSITEGALLFAMAYIASKVLGVLRQVIFNALFGTGPDATAYYAAFRLPDTLFNLIAGGALTYAFMPIFMSYDKQRGEREAWRLASLVFNVLLVSLTAFVLLAELVAPTFVDKLLVPGLPPSEKALTTTLTRIMLLHPLILGLGTVATAILNSRRQFLRPALSIAVYDLGLIGGLLYSFAVPGVGIYGPTFGLLASAFCQVGIQIPALLRQGIQYTFLWNLKHPGLYEVMGLLVPNLFAVGIASVGSIIDTAFASYLPDKSSIPAITNALMLFGLPSVLLAQAVSQSLLPQISSHATHGRYMRMSQTILKIVGGAVLLCIPAAITLYFLGQPAIHLLFQHGAFNAHSSALTSMALLGYAIGLPGLTADVLLVTCFYAMKDARTPLFTNIVTVVARIALLLLLFRLLTSQYAILAIPLAASIVGTFEAAFLSFILFMRLRKKMQTDKGVQRLKKRRLHAAILKGQAVTTVVSGPGDADVRIT